MQSKSYLEALRIYGASRAYQHAVIDLLVHEAISIANVVGIHEPISGDPNDVVPPADGLAGSVTSSNYTFSFSQGRFHSLRWVHWAQKIQPPITDMLEFATRPSQLDEDSALALARSWLTNLGVSMSGLAAKCAWGPSVFHVPAAGVRETAAGQARPMRPQFIIKWSGPAQTTLPSGRPLPAGIRSRLGAQIVTVEILGTTKQPIEITIWDPQLWTGPGLELRNATELLGAPPTPAELMARILTPATYAAIENADMMEAALLTSNAQSDSKRDRFGPIRLDPAIAKMISTALLDFDSYNGWSVSKGCLPDDGVRLKIKRGHDDVDVWFCFECDILRIKRANAERAINFDQGHDRFAGLFKEAFPNDAAISGIPVKGQSRARDNPPV